MISRISLILYSASGPDDVTVRAAELLEKWLKMRGWKKLGIHKRAGMRNLQHAGWNCFGLRD